MYTRSFSVVLVSFRLFLACLGSAFSAVYFSGCFSLIPPDDSPIFAHSDFSLDSVSLDLSPGLDLSLLYPFFREKLFVPLFPSGTILKAPFRFSGSSFDACFALISLSGFKPVQYGNFLVAVPSDLDSEKKSSAETPVMQYVLPLNLLTASFLSNEESEFFQRVGNHVLFSGPPHLLGHYLADFSGSFKLSFCSFVVDVKTASSMAQVVEPSDLAKFIAFGGMSWADFFLSEVEYILDVSGSKSKKLQFDEIVASGDFSLSRGVKDPYSTSTVSEGVVVQSAVQFIDTLTSFSGYVNFDFLHLVFSDASILSYSDDGYPSQSMIDFSVSIPYQAGKWHKVYSHTLDSYSFSLFDIISLGHDTRSLQRVYFVRVDPLPAGGG